MSSYLFPYTLPGVQFNYVRKYLWNTGVQKALSGKQSTIAYQQYPLVSFEYSFEFLKDYNSPPDIAALVGLHNAVAGRFDTFLHTDPDFNTVIGQPFGTSTGSTATIYQLTALYLGTTGWTADSSDTADSDNTVDGGTTTSVIGAAEIVQNLNGTPTLAANGAPIDSSTYTIGPTGLVTFTTSPAANAALTWSGAFYYRCRFDEDHYDWTKFMKGLWSAEKISFTSVIL